MSWQQPRRSAVTAGSGMFRKTAVDAAIWGFSVVHAQTIQQSTDHTSSPADIGSAVIATMRRMNVAALPQNYEIYYEALSNPHCELADDLAELGTRPIQRQLDEIGARHLHRQDAGVVADAHGAISDKLDEILALLKSEQRSLETYGRLLDETSNGLGNRENVSRDFLKKVISLMATATDTTIDHGRKIATSMSDKSSELQEVKEKLEKYKKLAEIDALTQLQNRRAFDKAIAGIFDDRRKSMLSALVLADIDRFKPVNDRHGHPVGDRILQIVGGIFTSVASSSVMVARTGGEEFALVTEGLSEDAVARLAEELRARVEKTPFVNVANGTNYGPITLSFGLCMASEADGPDDLYVKADRALYSSKSNGRNCITRFSNLAEGAFTKNWLLYRRE
jgi:diguanylate cyclase